MNKDLIEKTIYFSLFVQIVTSLLSFDGVNVKLNKKDAVLRDILKLELFVQVIESLFYIWVIFALKNFNEMTSRRYIDWVITTPTMLLSTIIFMKYQEFKENKNNESVDFFDFLKTDKQNIIKIVIFNGLMLLFGYLGERNIMNKPLAILIGFYFFYKSFNLIYNQYAMKSELGKKLFNFLFIIWGLYGVSASFDVVSKNVSYNLLDIIAKNFYGLFIYYIIKQKNKNLKNT